jgi:hypothetical protein
VITGIVAAIVLFLVFSVVVAVARDKGPGPVDAAVAYELAWDRLDFDAVFTLSGAELRDGLDRRDFVAAKRTAYEHQHALGGLVERVGIEEAANSREVAVVISLVELRDGSTVHNRIQLARRTSRWVVVAYQLVPSDEGSAQASG